jgi:hypothetical protein
MSAFDPKRTLLFCNSAHWVKVKDPKAPGREARARGGLWRTVKKEGLDKVVEAKLPDFANLAGQAGAATTVRSF